MKTQPTLAPFSELLRAMRWGRAEAYDKVYRGQLPIPIHRIGSRYFVDEADLARLRKAVAK
jgi:hypothetical protein